MARKSKYTRVECDICHGDFSESHITNHKRSVHGIYGSRGPRKGQAVPWLRATKPCVFCGKPLAANNMARHIKARHQGQQTEPVREMQSAKRNLPAIITRSNGKLTFHTIDNFVLLEASDNTLWLAEKIR